MQAGRYDKMSQFTLIATRAKLSVVMIIGGNNGNGFSVSTTDPALMKELPKLLREMARLMDATEGLGQNVEGQ